MTQYVAFEIDAESRARLLEAFPAKYPDIVAHHITHKYGAGAADMPAPPGRVEVTGYHDSGTIQVLSVEVDGRRQQAEAGRFYHITLSLDRSAGVSPRHSNDVLAAIVAAKGEDALHNLPEPILIEVTPRLLTDSHEPKPPVKAPRP